MKTTNGGMDHIHQSCLHGNVGFLLSSVMKALHSTLHSHLAGKLNWRLSHLHLMVSKITWVGNTGCRGKKEHGDGHMERFHGPGLEVVYITFTEVSRLAITNHKGGWKLWLSAEEKREKRFGC